MFANRNYLCKLIDKAEWMDDNMTSSLLVSWADGCLLACWQVYDKVFAIFNQVSGFTPISGPAEGNYIAEKK